MDLVDGGESGDVLGAGKVGDASSDGESLAEEGPRNAGAGLPSGAGDED